MFAIIFKYIVLIIQLEPQLNFHLSVFNSIITSDDGITVVTVRFHAAVYQQLTRLPQHSYLSHLISCNIQKADDGYVNDFLGFYSNG